jgi:O-antigen/teichoic acid export membrane protein
MDPVTAVHDPLDREVGVSRDGTAARQQLVRSGRWLGGALVVAQVIRIGSTVVLTHFLSPTEFGLMALVTLITLLFDRVLGDTGTTVALVQRPRLTQRLTSSVLWLNLGIGAATAALMAGLAAPIAWLLGDPDATAILRLVSLVAVLNAALFVPFALLRRAFDFRSQAAVNISGALVTAAVTLGLAVGGAGAWSLAWGAVSGSLAQVVIAWSRSGWRPARHFAWSDLREIARFSAGNGLFQVWSYVTQAGDRFVVGRLLGAQDLGFYGLANRLVRYPMFVSMQTYREVTFPALTRMQDEYPRLADTYIRSCAALSFALMPLMFGIAALADPLVRVFLGPEWIPAIPLLAIVAVTTGLQVVTTTTGSIYNAIGRTGALLVWGIVSGVLAMGCYVVGALVGGVEGVAWGYLVVISVLFVPAFAVPFRLIRQPVLPLFAAMVPPMIAAGAAATLAYSAQRFVADQGASDVARLVVGTAVGAVAYAVWAVTTRPPAMTDALQLVRVRRGRDPRRAARPSVTGSVTEVVS